MTFKRSQVLASSYRGECHSSHALSHLQAVGLAFLGYTLWVFSDTSLKIVGASSLPSYEVTFTLGSSISILLLGYGLWLRNLRVLWPRKPTRLVLRSLLDVANGFGVVVAVRHMPLALFYILIFCSPIVSTLLAALLLGEVLQVRRFLAVLIGFLGIVIAVHPFHLPQSGEWVGYVACFVCVMSFSTNVVWSRRITQTETPESLTFSSGMVVAGISFLITLCKPVPIPPRLAAVVAIAALFNVLGSLCFFRALKWASAASVAQCHYSQLLIGALMGFLIWHERLNLSMLLGAVLIITAGCYEASHSAGAEHILQEPKRL